jgi:hypothetical protein
MVVIMGEGSWIDKICDALNSITPPPRKIWEEDEGPFFWNTASLADRM